MVTKPKLYSYFTHPNKNCMNYYTHLRLSLYFSRRMFMASIKAIVHAFFPNFFLTSTTDTIDDIKNVISKYNCTNIIDYLDKYQREDKERLQSQQTKEVLPLSLQRMFYRSLFDLQNT